MWKMTLPPRLARLGRFVEFRVAPPLYRDTRIVTLSQSSKAEIIRSLKMREANISVVEPGIDPYWSAGGEKSATPLVVAVGRLVPVKRFHLLIDALASARERRPDMQAVIVGEGYERDALERQIAEVDAADWISLPGRVSDAELLDLYRRAWVVASASAHEGWGMTITEAAACGTPAVATRIAGHEDAIVDGRTGVLVDNVSQLGGEIGRLLVDDAARARLSANALEHSARFQWGVTACGTLQVLADEAIRRQRA
jgi:glycosyltransferase involved in cell wall biosynthesis